jgi:hypothetical protein
MVHVVMPFLSSVRTGRCAASANLPEGQTADLEGRALVARRNALCGLFQRPYGPLPCGRRVVCRRGSRELLNQDFYSCGAESGYKQGQKYQSYGVAPGHLCF